MLPCKPLVLLLPGVGGKGRGRKGIREKEVKERSDAEIKDNNKRN